MKYDLHIHTRYSNCSWNTPINILKIAKKIGLDGIAITDHNTIKGALKTKKINKDKNFEVIIGEEIKTEYGEILGIYLKERIKKRKLLDAIDEIKDQGGIVIIPHPFRPVPWLKFKYPFEKLKHKVDAIEIFNSRNILMANPNARKIQEKYGFAKVGSSDAHIPLDIGKGYTLFEGNLRKAIKNKKTKVDGTILYGCLSAGIAMVSKRILVPLKLKKEWT